MLSRKNCRGNLYIVDLKATMMLIGFASFIGAPAIASLFTDHANRSHWERRPLAEFPEIQASLSGEQSFFAELDAFLNDHAGLILEFNQLYRRLGFFLFQDDPTPVVKRGYDGFFFTTGISNTTPYSITGDTCVQSALATQIDSTVSLWIELLTDWQARGYRVALAVAPEKHGVYPEKLPISMPRYLREACAALQNRPRVATKLVQAANELGLTVVYPFEDFQHLKYEGNFFPRENFHWHGPSAHHTAKLLAGRLGIVLPDAYSENWKDVIERADISGQLGFLFTFRQSVPDYGVFGVLSANKELPAALLSHYKQSWKPAGRYSAQHPITDRTALLVGNSFTGELASHLAPMYRDLIWAQTNTWDSIETSRIVPDIIKALDPDDIIFVAHDSGLLRASKLLPPEP